MAPPIITLTTDFGESSGYVAQMKGAILSVATDVTIVDVTHAIRPQDIHQAALVIADTWRYFPRGTIHIAVVDPGVGTTRRILCAHCSGQVFIAPDNGLLTAVLALPERGNLVCLEEAKFWREDVSNTFHGRDIMGPVAAHLARGVSPAELGPACDQPVLLDFAEPIVSEHEIVGEIIAIDSFGNLVTNIDRSRIAAGLAAGCRVRVGKRRIATISKTYGDVVSGKLVAVFGASQRLEIAVAQGSAAQELGAAIGDKVWLERLDD